MRHAIVPAFFALLVVASALGGAVAIPIRAQDAPTRPAFEVTSVKPNHGSAGRTGAIQPGRFAQTSITLAQLIQMAYGTKEMVGGPRWMDADRFDVEGRGAFDLSGFLPSRDGSPPRVYVMLQRLLEDRFKLVVHTETQERPVYALVVRNANQPLGPRLQRSAVDCEALLAATVQDGRPPAHPPGAAPRCSMRSTPGHFWGDSISMSQLAGGLSTDRIVLDRTRLNGRFNAELEWTPDMPALSTPQEANPRQVDAPPSLFTAIQEQLGLKLEPTAAPLEVLVVDHVEPPTPN